MRGWLFEWKLDATRHDTTRDRTCIGFENFVGNSVLTDTRVRNHVSKAGRPSYISVYILRRYLEKLVVCHEIAETPGTAARTDRSRSTGGLLSNGSG